MPKDNLARTIAPQQESETARNFRYAQKMGARGAQNERGVRTTPTGNTLRLVQEMVEAENTGEDASQEEGQSEEGAQQGDTSGGPGEGGGEAGGGASETSGAPAGQSQKEASGAQQEQEQGEGGRA